MKRQYMKPAMAVVDFPYQHQLMAGSDYDEVTSPIELYDEDSEDDIEEKKDIW